jgi:hypothetical protein
MDNNIAAFSSLEEAGVFFSKVFLYTLRVENGKVDGSAFNGFECKWMRCFFFSFLFFAINAPFFYSFVYLYPPDL